jgi:hypothetical protein
MDEVPCAIVVGLAAIATVGVFGVGVGITALPPQEVRVEMAMRAAATSHVGRQPLADSFLALPEKRDLPKAVLKTAIVSVSFHEALAKITKGAPAPARTSRGVASMPQPT